jgi:hypothetical protein
MCLVGVRDFLAGFKGLAEAKYVTVWERKSVNLSAAEPL